MAGIEKNNLLIFDGRHLLWRASSAFSDLSAELGGEDIGTGAIYGFLSVAIRIHEKYGGRLIVAWEGRNNFRYKLYPKYKDKGDVDPDYAEHLEDMKQQEKRLKAILRAAGVHQCYGIGCEADDVIGTLSKMLNGKILIYSGDSDLHQLVTKKGDVKILVPGHGRKPDKIYGYKEVENKHGIKAEQIPDLKALAGDASDKIPGVKGVGQKTAVKLINKYGKLESVLKAASNGYDNWPVAERFKKMIFESCDDVRLFKRLTVIKRDVEIKTIKPKRSQKKILMHLKAYKFHSLITAPELKTLMRLGE